MLARSLVLVLVLVPVFAAACADAPDPDVDATLQGACSGLEQAACRAEPGCQLAYVDSGFQPRPGFLHCLALQPGTGAAAACADVDRATCRARVDCSPVFWQELGETDGPVGDPYYQRCASEQDLANAPSAR